MNFLKRAFWVEIGGAGSELKKGSGSKKSFGLGDISCLVGGLPQ